jgi:hypothetical protein
VVARIPVLPLGITRLSGILSFESGILGQVINEELRVKGPPASYRNTSGLTKITEEARGWV